MTPPDAVSDAYRALLDEVRAVEQRLLDADPPLDEQDRLDGYRFAFSILQVALDVYVWADSGRPRFVDIVGPSKKWGGDNADAYYQFAPVDPARTYVVRGRRGDSAYLSLTVYGGSNDGRYTDRIVGTVNDRDLSIEPDGTFELVLSPEPHDGSWLKLDPDSVHVITRDYLVDPAQGRRAEWTIESVDPPPLAIEEPADLARRFNAARQWVSEQAAMVPLRVDPPNEVQAPYPVPSATYGWAAGDAAYAMGSFSLEPDQALVIEGRSPECAFWNLCLWNPFLHTFDYRYEQVTLNGGQVVYEPDGSWRLFVSARDPGQANWVSTTGRRRGLLWFRWFLPAEVPERPMTSVIRLPTSEDGE